MCLKRNLFLNFLNHSTFVGFVCMFSIVGCGDKNNVQKADEADLKEAPISKNPSKVQVLNFATFHMGTTSDANSIDFDENDRKNQEDARKIAEMISRFRPTKVVVEYPYEKNDTLNAKYREYLANPEKPMSWYGEIGLVAFQVARMNGLDSVYGIDHKMGYNYRIGQEIVNEIDSVTLNAYYENPFEDTPEIDKNMDSLDLMGKLKLMNHPKFLDFLIAVNADMLAFAGTEGNFEGADEAAKYYQRNLRIYSNLNRLPLTPEDRVFILSGGSHTAFLNGFMERSPKYEVVDTFEYLKDEK